MPTNMTIMFLRNIISSSTPQLYSTLLNAGISVCANQNEKTSLGPVINSFGTNPLKKALGPSCFAISEIIVKPLFGLSKLLFWMRVLTTSRGAETRREALAPAMEATKFWPHVAAL